MKNTMIDCRARSRTHHRSLRRGLSFVEFMGCLVAMVGGVCLGSLYLGVDMQQMAIRVLQQAQVVSPTFFGPQQPSATRDASDPPLTAGPVTDIEATPAAIVATNDTSAASAEPAESAQPVSPDVTREPTAAECRAATRIYWDALTTCMHREAELRSQGFNPNAEWQIYDYLSRRKQGHVQALETLEGLNEFGVDPRLLAHGHQVISWNASAVKLFDRAVTLLTDSPNASLSGPFAQSWQSSATQLRMEEALIGDKQQAVASYLDHEYPAVAPFEPAFGK